MGDNFWVTQAVVLPRFPPFELVSSILFQQVCSGINFGCQNPSQFSGFTKQ